MSESAAAGSAASGAAGSAAGSTMGAAVGATTGSAVGSATATTADAIMNGSGGVAAESAVGGSINSIPAETSWTDNLRSFIQDYSKGTENNLGQFADNFGFNAQTAGYIGSKIPTSGGAPQAAPLQISNTFNTNQQDPLAEFKQRRQRMGY